MKGFGPFTNPLNKGQTVKEIDTHVFDLGNNETVKTGVFSNGNGTYTAITFTKSRDFKTESGARKWLTRQTAN
ncbi:DUF1391 domain-containing protein [Salmonella enterica subsp. enterica serovar Hvittingfoss]|nr:DUF1391 domain-containing protein [Salmonella enterica subsp. enterica serovar Hvittingfoss]